MRQKQRKFDPDLWERAPVQDVSTLPCGIDEDIATEGSCGEMNALDSVSIVLTIAIHIIIWTLVIFSGKTLRITEK